MSTLEEVLVEYFEKVDAGLPVDPHRFLADHPSHSSDLHRFFENLGVLNVALDELGQKRKQQRLGENTVLGDFRIHRELGRGGMGVVYEAEQISLGRRVALKVLHATAAANEQRLKRFGHEVQAIAALSHDHIVPVFAVGEQDGHHFYAMRFIDGYPLSEVHVHAKSTGLKSGTKSNSGKQPRENKSSTTNDDSSQLDGIVSKVYSLSGSRRFRQAANVVGTIAETLHYAHEQGIVHRDIKPSNLLVDLNGKVWVTDFGLAQLEHEATITVSGEVLGTVQYMSPEQAAGRRELVDRRTDVYSLGVLLYLLITGELPFRGQPRMVLKQALDDEPVAPRKLNHRIPVDLETICWKCLRKEPKQRYQTAKSLAEDLRRFRDGQAILARPATPLQQTIQWVRGRPVLTTAIALIVLATTITLGLLLRHTRVVSSLNQDLSRAVAEKGSALEAAASRAEELRWQAYGRDMKLAFEAWRNLWPEEVDRLLDEQIPLDPQPDHRGPEWQMLRQLNDRPIPVELLGHTGSVNDLAVFAAGTRMASVGDDATIQIWNLVTNEREFVLRDDRPMWVYSGDSAIDESLNEDRLPISNMGPGHRAIAVSPDGQKLVAGNLVLSLWDLTTRERICDLTGFPTRIYGVAFSPDGRMVATQGANEAVHVIDLDTREVRRLETGSGNFNLAFGPHGKHLLAPFSEPGSNGIRVWKVRSWDQVRDIETPSWPQNFAISPEGGTIVASDWIGRVHLLDYSSGAVTASLSQRRSAIRDVAVSPDGRVLASCSAEGNLVIAGNGESLSTVNLQLNDNQRTISAHRGSANAVCFVDHWRVATCGHDGVIRVWTLFPKRVPLHYEIPDATDGSPLCRIPGSHSVLVGTSHGFHVVDSVSARVVKTADLRLTAKTEAIAASEDGAYVAGGTKDGWLYLWDLNREQLVARVIQGDRAILSLSFSPDGKQLAVASADHTVRIRDTVDLTEVIRFDTRGHGRAVAFSPDGNQLAYADSEDSLVVRGTATWQVAAQQTVISEVRPNCLRYTPNGMQIVTAHNDSRLRVWGASSLTEQGEMNGELVRPKTMALDPTGKLVACCASDRVHLWHLPTLTDLGELGNGCDCVFLSNGRLVTLDYSGGVPALDTWPGAASTSTTSRSAAPDAITALDADSFFATPPSLADVDGDGDKDLVGFGTNGTWVSLNNGHRFLPPTQWSSFASGSRFDHYEQPRLLADLNGDQKHDLVCFRRQGVEIAMSTGSRFEVRGHLPEFGYQQGWRAGLHWRGTADVNGDGQADLVGDKETEIMVALSDGNTFLPAEPWRRPGRLKYRATDRFWLDIDGDRLDDLVEYDRLRILTMFSNGNAWHADAIRPSPFPPGRRWPLRERRRAADVDGDGRADLVGFGPQGIAVARSLGRAFGAPSIWTQEFGSTRWTESNSRCELADVNADGKSDVVGFTAMGTSLALSTGIGFAPSTAVSIFPYVDERCTDRDQWRAVVDVDGDGRADVVGLRNEDVCVSFSLGATFGPPAIWARLKKNETQESAPSDVMLALPPALGAHYVHAVAVDSDYAVLGTRFEDEHGAAHVFHCDRGRPGDPSDDRWSYQMRLLPDQVQPDGQFGCSVAIDGDCIVVGASRHDVSGVGDAGQSYVFARDGTTWKLQQTLEVPSETAGFGTSVAIQDGVIAVGAPGCDFTAENSGAVYLFVSENGHWDQTTSWSDSSQVGGNFGYALAMDGNTIVVTAQRDDPGTGFRQGAAHVYVRSAGGTWSRQGMVYAKNGQEGDWFGNSVALDGDTMVVSAWKSNRPKIGAAHVFERRGDRWSEVRNLTPRDSTVGDRFGMDVAIESGMIAVAAGAGQIHVYQTVNNEWTQIGEIFQPAAYHLDLGRSSLVVAGLGQGGATQVYDRSGLKRLFSTRRDTGRRGR